MWLEDFKNANKKEINWLLKVNEQSILTQNQNTVDLSRANLRKLQPDTGMLATVKMKIALTFSLFLRKGCMYAKRANEVLGILDEMDAVIRDQYSLSPSKLRDLLDVRILIEFITFKSSDMHLNSMFRLHTSLILDGLS